MITPFVVALLMNGRFTLRGTGCVLAVSSAVLVRFHMLDLGSCMPLKRLRMPLRCEESLMSQVAFACLRAARVANLPVSLAE